MASEQEVLKELCGDEIQYGCYDWEIDGIRIYSVVRNDIRNAVLKKRNVSVLKEFRNPSRNLKMIFASTLKSLWKIIGIRISRKKYDNCFFSFQRIDNIDGIYLDKFTDPIIEYTLFKGSSIVFDHGRNGSHPTPRLHENIIVYSDYIHVSAEIRGRLLQKRFIRKNREVLDGFFSSVDNLAEGQYYDKQQILRVLCSRLGIIRYCCRMFNSMSVRRVFVCARYESPLIAASLCGIRKYELQHGITYGDTRLYSGYRDPMLVPDKFLAFGDNNPKDVYGIDEKDIVNIGWGLDRYIADMKSLELYGKDTVLVISDPQITEALLKVVVSLAEAYPDVSFHIRLHPLEQTGDGYLDTVKAHSNISMQDRTVNVAVALHQYERVVGVMSTVLYEALSYHRKVGQLYMGNLQPKVLVPEDLNCFFAIHCAEDFGRFVSEDSAIGVTRSIYSKFDVEKINEL